MSLKVNQQALDYAKHLIDEGEYAINTVWSTNEPSPDQENRYLDAHGWGDYANWYLAVDSDDSTDTKEHYKFPYGDFKRVHRSGVIAAKRRAAQNDDAEVVRAADELLDLFDRLNAC